MREKLLPYAAASFDDAEIAEITDTLKSGWTTRGPKTVRFEEEFARYHGTKHAVAVSSCTAALHLCIEAVGVSRGDEVITTPYTFVATAETVEYLGAKPVFVDVRSEDCNLDPAKLESAITPKTRAIVPVHYAGYPCEIDVIEKIAKKHGLPVIYDAAHATESLSNGQKMGAFGRASCFSFYANKNLSTGEGGMITTNDDDLADRARTTSLHGMSKGAWKRYLAKGNWQYEISVLGYKYNFTDLQASLGIHQLQKLEAAWVRREEISQVFSRALSTLQGIEMPKYDASRRHAHHIFPIFLRPEKLAIDRQKFIEELTERNIGTSVHFIPLHTQPYYKEKYGYRAQDFPVAFDRFEREISLPCFPAMSDRDVADVVDAVREVHDHHAR